MELGLSEFLTQTEAAALMSISVRTFSRRSNDNTFPQPIRKGVKHVLYRRADILAWVDSPDG